MNSVLNHITTFKAIPPDALPMRFVSAALHYKRVLEMSF